MHGSFYTEKLKCKSNFEFFFTFIDNLQFLLVNSVSEDKVRGNTLSIYCLDGRRAKRECGLGSFILVDVLSVLPNEQKVLCLFDDVRGDGMFYCVIEGYDLFSVVKNNQHSLLEKISAGERVSYADTTRNAMLQKFQS